MSNEQGDAGWVNVTIEPVEAGQRFAFAAENIAPQPWRWAVESEHYHDWGYAAFRWTAWLWTRPCVWSFARRERLHRKTRPTPPDRGADGD